MRRWLSSPGERNHSAQIKLAHYPLERSEAFEVTFHDLQGEPYLLIRQVRDSSDTENSSFPLSLDTAQDAVEDGAAVKVLPFRGNGRAFELVVDATSLDPASESYPIVQRMVMSIQFEA